VLAYSRWHLRQMYERPGIAGEAERDESARECDLGRAAAPSSDSSLHRASWTGPQSTGVRTCPPVSVSEESAQLIRGGAARDGKLSAASDSSQRWLASLSGEGHIAMVIAVGGS